MKKCLYDAIVSLECVMAATSTQPEKLSSEALRDQTFQPTLGSLIMQSFKAVTIGPNETVDTASKKMVEFNSDYVIATSGSSPLGIFTSKDLLMRVFARNLSPNSTTVEKVMTRNVECASLDTTVVDALHIMRDGRFCHLPVVDQDRNVVGCVTVMELMECGFASAEEEIVKHSLSNSCTTERSDITANLTLAAAAMRNVYPSLWLANFFSFKVQDSKGCVHRFNCGTQSLEELVSTVALRIGSECADLQVLYKDDEGDLILLSSDKDLALAVSFAKAFGMKVLRLYVDYSHNPHSILVPKTRRWKKMTLLASILVIVGLGFLFHAQSSSKEQWKPIWNWDKLLGFRKRL